MPVHKVAQGLCSNGQKPWYYKTIKQNHLKQTMKLNLTRNQLTATSDSVQNVHRLRIAFDLEAD